MVSLKDLASKHNLLIGTAVAVNHLDNDQKYRDIISREFNIITPENDMKMWALRPNRETFFFEKADKIISFADSNGMKVRGHTLVWDHHRTKWLTEGNFSPEVTKNILEDHIKKTVEHFRGKLYAWDVVNEPIHNDKFGPENFWYEKLGPDYIEWAFRWTHEVDPKAKLFINEWGMEDVNGKSDAMYELVKYLLKKKVPIHGIGFQMHRGIGNPKLTGSMPNLKNMEENFKRFADLDLEIHVTEMDIQTYGFKGAIEETLKAQGEAYAGVVKTILKIPPVKALLFWGIFDQYSWIPYCFNHPDMAHLFDENYQPKPSYFSVAETLENS